MRQRTGVLGVMLAALALAACDNGGADRVLTVSATGIVLGEVYFDANGSGTRDAVDLAMPAARVRLLLPASGDTVYRVTAGTDGTFRLAGVAVGSYLVVVDSASAGDSARVVGAGSLITVQPSDSTTVLGAISFPRVSASAARLLAPGTRVFVTGVALHGREIFSDTTLHIVDTSGALRATRIRPSSGPVLAGDSVMLRGRIADRLGQRVLDDVTAFTMGPTFIPTAATITTAQAATAGAGTRDAALVRVLNAAITDTATVGGNMQLTMTDGSGAVIVILDRAADLSFRAPLPAGVFVAPRRFDVVGVLVPTGTGTWRLKPRAALDLSPR